MAEERIKLNKISLREQKQKKSMYERFLPALEARKQQLIMQIASVRKRIEEENAAMAGLLDDIKTWEAIYWNLEQALPYFVSIQEVRFITRNVAGLKIREFVEAIFDNPGYSFFSTPYTFEYVVSKTREVVSIRERIAMLKEQEEVLVNGFRKTSQRINLYEQRLIPACREAVRKISAYLQDQQAAAVGVAKVAKRLGEEATYYAD